MMSSPLFRWTFETPEKPVQQRADSDETFYDETEKTPNNTTEPSFQNEDMDTNALSQILFSSDSLTNNEELSQTVVSPSEPVAKNYFPSRDSIPPNLIAFQNNIEAPMSTHDERNFLDLGTKNSQHCNWIEDSQTFAPRPGKERTVSPRQSFCEGEEKNQDEIQTDVKSSIRNLDGCASRENICNNQIHFEPPEILTGLDDSQFNAYPVESESQAPSTDATFFEKESVKRTDVKHFSQCHYDSHLDTCNALDDVAMSPEILTGLDDSQFNSYSLKCESPAPSTDATFFEVAENRSAVQNHAFKQEFLECGAAVSKDATEILVTSTGSLAFESLPPNKNESTYTSEASGTNARPGIGSNNTDLNQDIVEFIENMAASPIFPMNENLNDLIKELTNSSDPSVCDSLSLILDGTTEIFDKLHLSPASLDDQSGMPKGACQTSVATKQKRVSSPLNYGEKKKRRTTALKSEQHLRPMGKPALPLVEMMTKKVAVPVQPLTPSHPMTLRSRNDWSAKSTPKVFTPVCLSEEKSVSKTKKGDYVDPGYVSSINSRRGMGLNTPKRKFSSQTAKSSQTPQIPSSKSDRNKKSSQRMKNSYFDPDYTSAYRTMNENLPRSAERISLKKLVRPTSKLSLKDFSEEAPSSPKPKRGRPRKIVLSDSKAVVPDSDIRDDSQNARSTDKQFLNWRSQRVDKLIGRHPKKIFRGSTSSSAETSVNDPWIQLTRDETSLRSMRERLLDIIFDEIPITKVDAENMSCEIRERQRRICKWNQSNVKDNKVCRLVKELEALCDTMMHQIDTLMVTSNRARESGDLPVPETNHIVSGRSDTVSPSPYLDLGRINISGCSSQKKSKTASKKLNLGGTVKKRRESEHTAIRQKTAAETKLKGFASGRRVPVESPRRPPVILISSQGLREDTLAEQNFSARRKEERNSSLEKISRHLAPANVCASTCFACGATLTNTLVDVGTDTDLVEPRRVEKKVLADRSTNTDPEDFNRECKRKLLVECGTNTDFHYSADDKATLIVGKKTLSCANKENRPVKVPLDFSHLEYVWLPRPEDFLPCSYDNLDSNAELPQELIDDLTWEND